MKDVIERGLVFIGGFRSVQEISGRFLGAQKKGRHEATLVILILLPISGFASCNRNSSYMVKRFEVIFENHC